MFGCGKTLCQVMVAKLLVLLGMHVILVAPTNAAVQAISESLHKHLPKQKALRLVTSTSAKAKRFTEDSYRETDIKGTEMQETAEIASIHENDESSGSEGTEPAADVVQTEEEEQQAIDLFHLMRNTLKLSNLKYNVVHEHDLQTHVTDLVAEYNASGQQLQFSYEPHNNEVQYANYDDEDGEETPTAETYDAIKLYSQFKDTDFGSLFSSCTEDAEKAEITKNRALFRMSLSCIRAEVVRQTQILLCTQQLAGSELVRKNFAKDEENKVVVIASEDGVALEPGSWIPLTLPRYATRVKGVITIGDRKQLPPLALSGTYNEFCNQLKRSRFDRHLRHHLPAVSLIQQYRMHPELSAFPNRFTYGGALINDPTCDNIQMDPIIQERLHSWVLSVTPSGAKVVESSFVRRMGVNVQGGNVEIKGKSLSKFNKANLDTIREMLFKIFEAEPYPAQTIRIATPYAAQRDLHLGTRRLLHKMTGLPYEKLPQVCTVDSMQGHECDCLILDLVRYYHSGLGFLSDNRRINVAITRAGASMVVVFRADQDYSYMENKKRVRKDSTPLEIIELWDDLTRSERVVVLDARSKQYI